MNRVGGRYKVTAKDAEFRDQKGEEVQIVEEEVINRSTSGFRRTTLNAHSPGNNMIASSIHERHEKSQGQATSGPQHHCRRGE